MLAEILRSTLSIGHGDIRLFESPRRASPLGPRDDEHCQCWLRATEFVGVFPAQNRCVSTRPPPLRLNIGTNAVLRSPRLGNAVNVTIRPMSASVPPVA